MLYSLNHHSTCRFEVRQALLYQLVSGLTDENGKYNYAKAVHHYPPFFDISCSAKNYKIASALTDTPNVEDTVVDKLLREKLYRCLAQLPKSEQDVLYALYFDGLSERQAGVKFGLHYMTIHNRKVKLLQQLKKMMEK